MEMLMKSQELKYILVFSVIVNSVKLKLQLNMTINVY